MRMRRLPWKAFIVLSLAGTAVVAGDEPPSWRAGEGVGVSSTPAPLPAESNPELGGVPPKLTLSEALRIFHERGLSMNTSADPNSSFTISANFTLVAYLYREAGAQSAQPAKK
jgi:hypothetical protein